MACLNLEIATSKNHHSNEIYFLASYDKFNMYFRVQRCLGKIRIADFSVKLNNMFMY